MGIIAYGVCVGSMEKVARNVLPRVSTSPILMRGQSSIASAYNAILASVRGRRDVEALVLLHDDLEITDPEFESKIRDALADQEVAVLGVAGATGVTSLAWWNHATVGHQQTDHGLLTFASPDFSSAVVDGLEGSLLVLSPWVINNLTFDERYDGFHGYDCDITRQALAAGKRVQVLDVDTHHHTTMGWKSPEVHESWLRADQVFREKWNL